MVSEETRYDILQLKLILVNNLHEMQKNGEFCDLTIVTTDGSVKVHQNVVTAAIPYFTSLYKSGLSDVSNEYTKLPFPTVLVDMVMTFVYSGNIPDDNELCLIY